MLFKRVIILFSKALNKILSHSNPAVASLNDPNKYALNAIGNTIENCEILPTVKLYAPYRLSDSRIDSYTYISENAKINFASVGKFCSIGPNFLCGWGIHPIYGISTSPMFYSTVKQNGYSLSKTDKIEERKKIVIGNDVFIGMNVAVLDGVTIGDGAVIGAGAIVSKDIPPYSIAAGSPIKILKQRFSADQITALLKIEWWNFSDEKLTNVEKMFFDVDKFIQVHS